MISAPATAPSTRLHMAIHDLLNSPSDDGGGGGSSSGRPHKFRRREIDHRRMISGDGIVAFAARPGDDNNDDDGGGNGGVPPVVCPPAGVSDRTPMTTTNMAMNMMNPMMAHDPDMARPSTLQSILNTPEPERSPYSSVDKRGYAVQVVPKIVCETCGDGFTCDSLLRKHQAKHTKPFKCKQKGCDRQLTGFTSPNDLKRHENSVHKGSKGTAVGYNCRYDHCRDRNKIYFRLDNFRSHLKKLHTTREPKRMSGFLKQAEQECRVEVNPEDPNQESASETASSVRTSRSQRAFSATGSSVAVSLKKPKKLQWVITRCDNGNLHRPRPAYYGPLEEESSDSAMEIDCLDQETAIATAATVSPGIQNHSSLPLSPDGQRPCSQDDQILTTGMRDTVICGKTTTRSSIDFLSRIRAEGALKSPRSIQRRQEIDKLKIEIKKMMEKVQELEQEEKDELEAIKLQSSIEAQRVLFPGEFARKNRSPPPLPLPLKGEMLAMSTAAGVCRRNSNESLNRIRTVTYAPSSPKAPRPDGRNFRCMHPGCKSTFKRDCELRKHRKRHTRPYGCTFRYCGKSFGSKNDWKRHENSQHHKLESWKCNFPVHPYNAGDICGQIYYRKENFVNHLKSNVHGIKACKEIATWTEKSYIGGNAEHQNFWCGFCVDETTGRQGKRVVLKNRGLAGWDERFDHLGLHFEMGFNVKNFTHQDEGAYPDCSELTSDDDESTSQEVLLSPPGQYPTAGQH